MLLREVRKSARLGRLTMTMFVPKVKFGYTSLAFIRQLKSNLMSIFLDVVQESSHSFDIALSEQNSLSLAHWAECRCPFSHLFRFPCESDLKRLGHYSVKVKPPLSVVVFFKKMTFGLTSFFFFFFLLSLFIYSTGLSTLCLRVSGVDTNVKLTFFSLHSEKPGNLVVVDRRTVCVCGRFSL